MNKRFKNRETGDIAIQEGKAYTVKEGNSEYKISARFVESSNKWEDITPYFPKYVKAIDRGHTTSETIGNCYCTDEVPGFVTGWSVEKYWDKYLKHYVEITEKEYKEFRNLCRIYKFRDNSIPKSYTRNKFGKYVFADWEPALTAKECIEKDFEITVITNFQGERINLGDEVQYEVNEEWLNNGVINKFSFIDGDVLISTENNAQWAYISDKIRKVPKPVFTASDGVDIYKNDEYYYVSIKNFKLTHDICGEASGQSADKVYFGNFEEAKEFLLLNKPVLSLKEMLDMFEFSDNEYADLYNKVRSKINDEPIF